MALTAENIADLVSTTLRDLGKGKWSDLTSDIQKFYAMPQMLKEKKVGFDSGYGIQWNVMLGTSGAARNVGLYQTDNVNVADRMTTANVPWRHTTTDFAIERREVLMNKEASRIVELVKVRRADAMVDLAKRMEIDFWSKPDSSSDVTTPYGLKYWIVNNATEGFNGGNPTGFATCAGIDASTVTQWRNWSSQYTNVTRDDLVSRVRKAMTYCDFRPPVETSSYAPGKVEWALYTNYDVLGTLETLLEDQNENLGNDLASKDGQVMFRRCPVYFVPQLDSDTADPIYGIDWSVFKPVFLKGDYMYEHTEKAPSQSNVTVTHIDTTYNYECRDRRRLFVVYK
jgi:hypothetical protein